MVWSPYIKKNIDVVEKVQRRAAKFNLKTEDNYETRLRKLNLISLKNRRFLADVTFLYKALNGISNINIDSYVDFYSDADHYLFRKYHDLSHLIYLLQFCGTSQGFSTIMKNNY